MIHIGSTTPDTTLEDSNITRAVTRVAAKMFTLKNAGGLPSAPHVDLVLMLSSANNKPPFDGLRATRFSKLDNTLYFEASVPESMNQSKYADQYINALLLDTLEHACDYFDAEKVSHYVGDEWESLIDEMTRNTIKPDVITGNIAE